jgi:dihydroorotate dehydrogenase electron transfer subunit
MFAHFINDVKITQHDPICSDTQIYAMRIEHPGWKQWKPGQFAMLRAENFGLEEIWGRPISIAGGDDDGILFYYQVLGRGTAKLAQLKVGDPITVWGPLGNFFAKKPEAKTLVLAGGIGLPPFIGYVKQHDKPENIRLIFGHTGPKECYPLDEIASADVVAFHEQGPEDLKRFIALLEEEIGKMTSDDLIVSCGPTPLLMTVQRICHEKGLRAQLSLENKMGCGVGACLGCVVPPADGGLPMTVCSRGPVFWSDEIDFNAGRK